MLNSQDLKGFEKLTYPCANMKIINEETSSTNKCRRGFFAIFLFVLYHSIFSYLLEKIFINVIPERNMVTYLLRHHDRYQLKNYYIPTI